MKKSIINLAAAMLLVVPGYSVADASPDAGLTAEERDIIKFNKMFPPGQPDTAP
jgi:hypothetical protein